MLKLVLLTLAFQINQAVDSDGFSRKLGGNWELFVRVGKTLVTEKQQISWRFQAAIQKFQNSISKLFEKFCIFLSESQGKEATKLSRYVELEVHSGLEMEK